MDKEKYVTFDTAELLKEKNFDWECRSYYEYFSSDVTMFQGMLPELSEAASNFNNKGFDICSRPTQQMAMRWLHEEKGIHPELELCTDNEFSFTIYKLDGKRTVLYEEKHCWTKPEDAIETAILYVLNNLI